MLSLSSSSKTTDNISKTTISPRKHNKYKEIITTLPNESGWKLYEDICKYQGFWFYPTMLEATMSVQEHFIPQPTDIIVSSCPKSGTTWLKALVFAILTRTHYSDLAQNHLLIKLPHDIVSIIEFFGFNTGSRRDLQFPIMSTHIPYTSLPKSIIDSECKIIYIYRDPKDVFISLWHFTNVIREKVFPLKEAFEKFCEGVCNHGPYWDHVLGYWKASLQFPKKILFIKFKDLKADTLSYVKRMAEFMGCPFSMEEEKQEIMQKIASMCSFKNLSNLEVNKNKEYSPAFLFKIENKAFFKKGKIGDWKNYLTPEMALRLDQITKLKFHSYGSNF